MGSAACWLEGYASEAWRTFGERAARVVSEAEERRKSRRVSILKSFWK